MRRFIASAIALTVVSLGGQALAVGESDADGFPNWEERVLLELTNRARVDPQLEMTQCGSNCAEAACYTVQNPLYYRRELGRAARFHGAFLTANGYFAHETRCNLVAGIEQLYPNTCDGAASCACVGGALTGACPPNPASQCTSAAARVGTFGGGYQGEIIAGGSSPNQAFYLWLYESAMGNTTCQFTLDNGHRWLLLTSSSNVGFGVDGQFVGDFGGGAGETHKIASGTHWPRQAATVEAWANWIDSAGPNSALVNVDGECVPMALTRGTGTNGAYLANLSSVGAGCSRYFFLFRDSNDQIVTYPETGSLGIGPAATCADFNDQRPTTGASCNCTPQCGADVCGDDSCGGSCGNCADGSTCAAGQCIEDNGTGGGGTNTTGTSSSGSGSGGSGAGIGAGGGTSGAGSDTTSGGANGLEDGPDDGGLHGTCACRQAGGSSTTWPWLLSLLGGAIAVARRRR